MEDGVTEPAAEAVETTTTTETGEAPASTWFDSIDGLSDENKEFIGNRGIDEFFEQQRTMRQSLSKRADDLVNEYGFIKPLDAEGDPIEFAKAHGGAAKEIQQYMDARGLAEEDVTAFDKAEMEAAIDSGLSPEAFTKMKEATAARQEESIKEEALKNIAALKEEWGADAIRNTQSVERAIKELGWSEDEVQNLNALNQNQATGMMKLLAQLGEFSNEGGMPKVDTNNLGSASSLQDQLTSIEKEIAKGGASPDQTRRRDAIIDAMLDSEEA